MCGIAGILFSRDYERNIHQRIEKMQEALQHRGPDDQNNVSVQGGALAHTRLSLLDFFGGRQPFCDDSKRYYLVYNGEIYNHKGLRQELSGFYKFRTYSDAEVVLAAYLYWGEDCVYRFEGMFSFLIWDSLSQSAFAARDHLGVKPFVYSMHNGEFIFASEAKAILAGWQGQTKLNEMAFAEFLVMPSFSGVRRSLVEGIRYLGAGEKMSISKAGLTIATYYDFEVGDKTSTDYCLAGLKNSLYSSTKQTMEADFPVGSFLSGGLDSSLITSIAAEGSLQPIKCFTIRFQEHDQVVFDSSSIVNSDDKPFVEELAQSLNIDLHRVFVSSEDLLSELQQLSRTNDRMAAWEQELSQYFLSKAAKQFVKAVLVGDAADETHYGYFFLLDKKVNYSPLGLMKVFDAPLRERCLAVSLQKKLQPVKRLEQEYLAMVEQAGYTFCGSYENRIRATTYLIIKLWLGRLLHNGDIHTMQHGLEARVPFANKSILNEAAKIHPLAGFKNNIEKYCLREAGKSFLSQAIYKRKKSSLPRDPRLGLSYQKILLKLLQENKDFANVYLNVTEIERLCNQQILKENERILLFNLISAFNWWRCYCG